MDQKTHEEIVLAFNNYLKEAEAFEGKGVKAAAPDALCPPLGGDHCAPVTASGSSNVFVGD